MGFMGISLIPLFYSLLVVSCLSSKLLNLALHVHSVSPERFILYLPTLFFQDVVVVVLGRVLLRGIDGLGQQVSCAWGVLMALLTYGAAAVQFGFFWETGSQVEWGASSSFLRDPAAMKILFSGAPTVALAGAILFAVSFLTTPYLYALAGNALSVCGRILARSRSVLPPYNQPSRICSIPSMAFIVGGMLLLFIRVNRPRVPYDHLSSTLPFSMSAALHGPREFLCRPRPRPQYPFPDLISKDRWEPADGDYPGWTPNHGWPMPRPKWLPETPPPGFGRWMTGDQRVELKKNKKKKGEKHRWWHHHDRPCTERNSSAYNAVADPTKISNLNEDVYPELKAAFDESVEIEHVVLLVMESARKDVFPMKEGTWLHDTILKAADEQSRKAIADKLSMLTPTAQMVTREYGANNSASHAFEGKNLTWRDQTPPNMGGINVQGVQTASSLTLKSLLGLHCGVSPLPVDTLEEVAMDYIYQPCLPHILSLFNSKKPKNKTDEVPPLQERAWKSVFVQSSTDSYDRQADLTEQMGFEKWIVKETIEDKSAAHYPPKTEELNYFGYLEEELEPYIKDLIAEAAENKTRLFLSHMTLTTHHPWKTPPSFKRENYFGQEKSKHEHMNSFLNTVRYVDDWVGNVLGYLEEAGIADKTLVVMVGDHGQAFEEDDNKQGTYENSHISNFRVPIVFRHPRLPHMNIQANASTGPNILPTVLDLLAESKSLNEVDTGVVKSMIHEYQGQSLIRPFKSEHNGRRVWNMGIINAGGSLLAVMSADLPYRLVVPITQMQQPPAEKPGHRSARSEGEKTFEYRFTHTDIDPTEQHALHRWMLSELRTAVQTEYGAEAAEWTQEAAEMARWWIAEQKRIWNYR